MHYVWRLLVLYFNKPSFCSGSCGEGHATKTKQTFFARLLKHAWHFLETLKKCPWRFSETPWNHYETLSILSWRTVKPCNFLKISMKHSLNTQETFFKLPWNSLESLLKHPGNFLETLIKSPWNSLEMPKTVLKLSWNTLETSLKHP